MIAGQSVLITLFDGDANDPVVETAERIQQWLANRLPTTSNYGWYVLGGVVVIGAAVIWSQVRRDRETSPT